MFGALGLSLAPKVRANRTLYKYTKPLALWYADLMGYRRMGLKYDDCLLEETDDVQRAIRRLTPREGYDRAYRFKRASQASIAHKDLPKDQWISAADDVRYLKPHVEDVEKEGAERLMWDTMEVKRK